MENRDRIRLRLAGVALGVLGALLLWPATRWIVRAQLACLIPGRPSANAWAGGIAGIGGPGFDAAAKAAHAAAVAAPDDYTLQLADATVAPVIQSSDSGVKLARLRELAKRFPNQPSSYANILRASTLNAVHLQRDEQYLVAPKEGRPTPTPTDPDQLVAFDRDAAEGERLDPDNAYFPWLRSIGLFENHRDAEALAALHRAAQKPLWNEYYGDELDGEWKLMETSFADNGALPRFAAWAGILLPHYAQLRATARMAVAAAMEAEQTGRIEQGIAIREDLMRCGGLARAESRCLIGNLVGSSIALLALQRPQGAALIEASKTDPPATARVKVRARLIAQYDTFLRHVGHPEQLPRVKGEAAAAAQMWEVVRHNTESDVFGPMFWQLGLGWWAGIQLLCAAIWTLVLGGAAAIAYRSPRLRAGQALPAWAARGGCLGLLAAAISGVIVTPVTAPPVALWLTSTGVFGLLCLLLPAANRTERLRTMAAYAVVLAASGAFLLLFSCHVTATAEPIRKTALYLFQMNSEPEHHNNSVFQLLFLGSQTADILYCLATILATAAVPLLAALSFLVVSRGSQVPLSVAIVRGFRGCAVPIACVLLLAYAVLAAVTLRVESATDDVIRQSVRHEGRYVAGLEGREWPGRIP